MKLKESTLTFVTCKSALYIFFISDGLNKLFLYFEYDFNRVSIIFRSFFEIIFFLIILLFLNRKRLQFLGIFFLLFVIFLFGQILFSYSVDYEYGYFENIIIYNKYYFVIIVYFSLYRLPDSSWQFGSAIKTLENILLINSIAAFTGLVFQIDFFRTYLDQSYRYGYSGFIPAQNEATLFYFIGISYFYYQTFIRKEKPYKFWFFVLSALLLGTKAIYIYLVLMLIFHFITTSSLKAKSVTAIAAIVLLCGIFWFLKTEASVELLSYFTSKAQDNGWFQMILSGRNILLETKGFRLLGEWSFINYLIGGQDQERFLIEMDLFDLFLFMGIVGGLAFLGLYFSTLFRFSLSRPFNFFFVATFFGLATFGGHFFSSAVNGLYLCLVAIYFYSTQNESRFIGKKWRKNLSI